MLFDLQIPGDYQITLPAQTVIQAVRAFKSRNAGISITGKLKSEGINHNERGKMIKNWSVSTSAGKLWIRESNNGISVDSNIGNSNEICQPNRGRYEK